MRLAARLCREGRRVDNFLMPTVSRSWLQGVKRISRLTLHQGSDYIISRATFPGYFLKDKVMIDHSWAGIDLLLFREYIAPALEYHSPLRRH